MTPSQRLPVDVLEPIASGTASCAALWEPLLGVARFHPVRLFGTDAYDVWLEALPADGDRSPAAVSAAVMTGAGAFTVDVHSPPRSAPGVAPTPPAPAALGPMAACPALGAARVA